MVRTVGDLVAISNLLVIRAIVSFRPDAVDGIQTGLSGLEWHRVAGTTQQLVG